MRIDFVQEQVQHGLQPELFELTKIKGVAGFRARQLFDAGLRSIRDVADADPTSLVTIFTKGRQSLKTKMRFKRKCQTFFA